VLTLLILFVLTSSSRMLSAHPPCFCPLSTLSCVLICFSCVCLLISLAYPPHLAYLPSLSCLLTLLILLNYPPCLACLYPNLVSYRPNFACLRRVLTFFHALASSSGMLTLLIFLVYTYITAYLNILLVSLSPLVLSYLLAYILHAYILILQV
jgi:hypothetical protein